MPLVVSIMVGVSLLAGMFFTESSEEMIAYLLITAACAAPCLLWIWAGSASIPIMAAIAVLFYIYYGIPILRGTALGVTRVGMSEIGFSPSEILSAGGTVTLFLFVATISWSVVLVGMARAVRSPVREITSGGQFNKLIAIGLAGGIL